jgi:uncharacterized radical SAM superfamily protein
MKHTSLTIVMTILSGTFAVVAMTVVLAIAADGLSCQKVQTTACPAIHLADEVCHSAGVMFTLPPEPGEDAGQIVSVPKEEAISFVREARRKQLMRSAVQDGGSR